MERDGQGWPIFKGRRLPQVHVLVGYHVRRDAWGFSIAGGMDPTAPPGHRFYRLERSWMIWTADRTAVLHNLVHGARLRLFGKGDLTMKTVAYPAPQLPADEMATLKALCDGPIPTTRIRVGVIDRLDAAGLIVQGDALDPDTARRRRRPMVRHVAITERGREIVSEYRRLLQRSHDQ